MQTITPKVPVFAPRPNGLSKSTKSVVKRCRDCQILYPTRYVARSQAGQYNTCVLCRMEEFGPEHNYTIKVLEGTSFQEKENGMLFDHIDLEKRRLSEMKAKGVKLSNTPTCKRIK